MSKLYFRYAAMNAGKSTQVLQIAHNYEMNDRKVALWTAQIDDRYAVGVVTSRLGAQRAAQSYTADTDFKVVVSEFARTAGHDVGALLIDEAQFLTSEQVKDLHQAAHQCNVPVMCFGLRTDFRGEPFPGAAMLMCLSEDIEEIRTTCKCGSKATMNIRTDVDGNRLREGPQVLIGDAVYRPSCGDCFHDVVKLPRRLAA